MRGGSREAEMPPMVENRCACLPTYQGEGDSPQPSVTFLTDIADILDHLRSCCSGGR